MGCKQCIVAVLCNASTLSDSYARPLVFVHAYP